MSDAAALAALYNRGVALFGTGQVDQALVCFQAACRAADPELAALARRSLACIAPGAAGQTDASVRAARRDWIERLAAAPVRLRPRDAGERVRVGYLSSFFGARNWMKPVWGVVNRHDRDRFQIHMFADGADPSADSGYEDVASDTVHRVAGLDDLALARAIGDAGLDVLVDLNGYSAQDRLRVLRHRPAPAIVGWFNHFAPSGLAEIDWLVGDDAAIPRGEGAAYGEAIHRVPGSYLAFEVTYETPAVAPPPCVASGAVTFGCLGSQYKLTDGVLAAWGKILTAAPRARLRIGNAALDDAAVRESLLARLAAQGVAGSRVTLSGRAEHLAFLGGYGEADIALDTFPYNGGTTTTEALWQGVPVLAFTGDRWAARTSRSLLLAAGLGDWVMADVAGYVARAAALANDPATPAMLTALRAGMRDRLRASAACDTAGLCRSLEDLYWRLTFGAGSARR